MYIQHFSELNVAENPNITFLTQLHNKQSYEYEKCINVLMKFQLHNINQ